MPNAGRLMLVRLAPVILLVAAAGFWFNEVQSAGPYVLRNLVPPAIVVALATLTLVLGKGSWSGRGWSMPLGTLGFAIPAIGLAIYLHYAFAVNLDDMFAGAEEPGRVFRYLPIYTCGAGAIGFIIGWIVGRNA